MNRRRFLEATAAGSLALALRPVRLAAAPREGCALLDLGDGCALPESLAGWATTGARVVRADAGTLAGSAMLVLPGAVDLPQRLAPRLLRQARGGATVIVESGALFGDAASFAAHRDALRDGLGVDVAAPVSLWPRARGGVPYVEYRWPVVARVRDFSRAIPLVPRAGDEVIARVDGRSVALRRALGAGALIVLGSPLGPALHAGDADGARQLLGALGFLVGRSLPLFARPS